MNYRNIKVIEYSMLSQVVYHVELYDNFTKQTANNVNSRGRKICPITFRELNTDNTIELGNVLFSTNGILTMLKQKEWYPLINDQYYYFNSNLLMEIKNPVTNVFFSKEDACKITGMLLRKIPCF
jgi:hypothetical protein